MEKQQNHFYILWFPTPGHTIYSTREEDAWADNPRTSTALEESTLDPTTPEHLQHSRRARLTRQPPDIYSTRAEDT